MVCKILEPSKESRVFNYKNPWVSSVLGLLSEIANNNIKMSLKCEIQLLFKHLEIESTVRTSKLLRQPCLKIQQLPDYIQIDSKSLGVYQESVDLRILVAQAVESAIKDIIQPVLNRSVTQALITTRELTLKDLCYEPDELKVLKSVHLMVQELAGSLALITSRDPFRQSLQNHLKDLLDQILVLDDSDKDKIVSITTNDNLDLGCALIKKAVREKAIEDANNDIVI